MRIAVLANERSWYLRDLCRAASVDHEICRVSFEELGAELGVGPVRITSARQKLHRFEALLVRTMPPGTLEQVIFRMDVLASLESAGCLILNPPKAIEVAVDKYLALFRLSQAGLTVPRTCVCQTALEAIEAFERLGGDVVIKPLFGSEGRGITRVTDEELAARAFRMLESLGAVVYLQEFIPHAGCDWRVLVIGHRLFGMKRRNADDWRTNVSRGAVAEPLEIDDRLAAVARRAAAAVGASVAGVDVLPDRDGQLYVLEVNAVPGWKRLAQELSVDIAQAVLEHVETLAQKMTNDEI